VLGFVTAATAAGDRLVCYVTPLIVLGVSVQMAHNLGHLFGLVVVEWFSI
jgi:hypothetical protein